MSIRFKFRSSVNFDAVEIDGRSSISVRELRSKIIRHKNLNVLQDVDLVFSDAVSGQEYDDDNIQIPSGSSVIVKRVPAGTMHPAKMPSDTQEKFDMKDFDPFTPPSGQIDEFDDFGAELCPITEAILPELDRFDKNSGSCGNVNIAAPRLVHEKVVPSDLYQALHKGGNERNFQQEPRTAGQMKLENAADLPSELKCSLCNTFFKEAVMIPCCQHSFCERCICQVITEKGRCPKCFSSKCRIENLLPNLSLRQAISHFLESQMPITISESALRKYAPDGESGIQANNTCCAVTVVQREPELPDSPSATGKGSNQVMADSFYERFSREKRSFCGSNYHMNNLGGGRALISAPSVQKVQPSERGGYAHKLNIQDGLEGSMPVPDFQGENHPIELQRGDWHDEAESSIKQRKQLRVDPGSGDNVCMATNRHRKVDRHCYMCGSPDHLIRDCPVASGPRYMLQTGNNVLPGGIPGYPSDYWASPSLPNLRPLANMFGQPGMPFNASMVPVSPFGVPPYMPSMYGGVPAPGGIMRMAGFVPLSGNRDDPDSHPEYLELQHCEDRRKVPKENSGRRGHQHDHIDEPKGLCEHKVHRESEPSRSHSEDSFTRRSRRKHHDKYVDPDNHSTERHERSSHSSLAGRDRKAYPTERSNSEIGITNNIDRYGEARHKHHQGSAKKHHVKRGHDSSDSSRDHHQFQKEDLKRHKHNRSESGLSPSSPGDERRRHKDKDSGRDFRHLRHSTRYTSDELQGDRWQMVSGSDEDRRDARHHHHKRKRVH